ncbi:hypothetical protein [Nocardia vulneris]|nr:hypothetical protein [Nocardia vulneris]
MIETALVTAVQADGEHAHAVGIWVVCLWGRQVVACQFVARLDIDPVTFVPAESTGVVLIAVAPCRVSDAVIARVEFAHDFLSAHGLDVRAIYLPVLVPGGMWSSLRGSAIDGIVPSRAAQLVPVRHPRRLPFLGRGRHRWPTATMVPLAALVFALPIGHAVPTGQPGIAPPRPGAGQAGVTAPPSAKTIAAAPSTPSPTDFRGNDEPVPGPLTSATSSSGRTASTVLMSDGSVGFSDDADAKSPPDAVCVGSLGFPRPQWIPEELADKERAWNAFAATRVASVLNTAGLHDPAISSALGADEGEAPAVPEGLEPVAAILPDPTEAAGLPDPVADWVEEVGPSIVEAVLSVTAQFPVWWP